MSKIFVINYIFFITISRSSEQITVPGVHHIRPKDVSGNKTMRTSLVFRSSARLQAQELRQEEDKRRLQTRLLGTMSGRERILLSVNTK